VANAFKTGMDEEEPEEEKLLINLFCLATLSEHCVS
jgi:hypothetical protein